MSETVTKKLFQLICIGNLQLSHRVVLAPLKRNRANDSHVPTPMMIEYHAQRASVLGTLLIAKGMFIAAKGGGLDNVPGIWSDVRVEEWTKVTNTVHTQGSYIFMQLHTKGERSRSYPSSSVAARLSQESRRIIPSRRTVSDPSDHHRSNSRATDLNPGPSSPRMDYLSPLSSLSLLTQLRSLDTQSVFFIVPRGR